MLRKWNKFRVGPWPCNDRYIGEDFNEEYFCEIREKRITDLLNYEIQNESEQNWEGNYNLHYTYYIKLPM